jgi:hypothetical protein
VYFSAVVPLKVFIAPVTGAFFVYEKVIQTS